LKFYRISNVVYTLFFILLTLPAIYFHGFIGAGYSWIVSNLFIFVVVNSKLNSHFDKNLNTRFWRKILFRLFQIILIISVSYYFISWSSWNNLFKFSSFVIIVSIGSYFIVRKDLLNLLGE